MALTYSLKYKKLNFFNKVLIEKEGEIVVDRQSFRLKGKGAQDLGQIIFFSDIKDLLIREDLLTFTTYTKEKYILSNFANLFDSFLKDFIRVRNEFLAEALFMKSGMLVREYEGSVEVVSTMEKVLSKGKCRIQFYEGSIVIIPEVKESFAVHLNFLKSHEFDEEEFVLRLYLENGQTVNISKLGTAYDEVRETIEAILGKMYERLVAYMSELMPEFDAETLLKFINKVREGRFIALSALKRIHENAPSKIESLAFANNSLMKEKIDIFRKIAGDQNTYVSFSMFKNQETGDINTRSWFLCALPEKNIIAVGQSSDAKDNTVYYFKIIMQQGDAHEKLSAKIREIEQVLLIFRFDFTSIYKERREIRKSKYKTASRKLAFVRLLRKSYIGYSNTLDLQKFEADISNMVNKAKISPAEVKQPSIQN